MMKQKNGINVGARGDVEVNDNKQKIAYACLCMCLQE
jgi:hypothetical protein